MANNRLENSALLPVIATTVLCCVLVLGVGSSLAMDSFFVGARGLAMAGANTASVNDYTAQYYNPAAFGFFSRTQSDRSPSHRELEHRHWGVGLDAGAGARIQGDLATYTDELSGTDIDSLSDGIDSQSEAEELVKLTNNLTGLDKPNNAITTDFNAGLGIRIGHFAMGGRGMAQAVAVPKVDKSNFSLSQDIEDINDGIEDNVSGDGNVELFNTEQKKALEDAGFSQNATEDLDYLAREEGVEQDQLEGMVDLLEKVANNSGSNSTTTLDENESSIFLRGFGLAQVPLSYGCPLNEHLSLGGNLKLMRGRVYVNEVLVFDEDSDKFLEETREQYKETTTFGIDMGIMARYKRLKLGVVGRNLNSPKFESPTVDGQSFSDVTLDPQARAGLAWQPFDSLTLETDIDLTKNETVFKDYYTRYFSVGAEWSVLYILNLRGGMYTNIAEDDIGPVYTAGLGLDLWGANLEVAAAVSDDKAEYEGDKYPKEARVTAQLGLKF